MYAKPTCVSAKLLQSCLTFATQWAVACRAPLSRQEYWSGLPRPPPCDLPHPGINPASLMSPALAGGFFTTSAPWEALSSVQFSRSVVLNCSMPGLPVHHQLPEFTQTHVHQVGDAIQPSHPLSSPSPPARSPSQHQDRFQWINSSHKVAKVLEFQLQHQSFQWIVRDFL